VAPLKLLAAATGALLVSPYLPVFKLENGPLVRALGTGTRGWVIGVPVGSWHTLPSPVEQKLVPAFQHGDKKEAPAIAGANLGTGSFSGKNSTFAEAGQHYNILQLFCARGHA
jgi:hypothetical protein